MTFLVIALARRRKPQVHYLALLQSRDGARVVFREPAVNEPTGRSFVWYGR